MRKQSCFAGLTAGLVLLGLTLIASVHPAAAQTAKLTRWSVPTSAALGAVDADASSFYSASLDSLPRLFRLTPGSPLTSAPATGISWNIGGFGPALGGIKVAGQKVYVRTFQALQIVDLTTHTRTIYPDAFFASAPSVSDIAVENDGPYSSIFSVDVSGVLQKLTPTGAANLTHWFVGGGAGSPFLSGIACDPTKKMVYFSAPGTNAIGELDPVMNKIRRWSLSAVGAWGPGQLCLDSLGCISTVTESNHIVQLNPLTDEMRAFSIPTPSSDPGAIACNRIIGFTETTPPHIGCLEPPDNGTFVTVTPSITTVLPSTSTIPASPSPMTPDPFTASPVCTTLGEIETGNFMEFPLPDGSAAPGGIVVDPNGPSGTFVFTAGNTIGHMAKAPPPPPNQPPTINCPEGVTAECNIAGGAVVPLTVLVEDADGDALEVTWKVDGTVVQTDMVAGGGPFTSALVSMTGVFSKGAHSVEVTVTDGQGGSDSCQFSVNVADTKPPVVTCDVAVPLLSPPDHTMVNVGFSLRVADVCDPFPKVVINVFSDMDDEVPSGGGVHSPDAKRNVSPGSLRLRAERPGTRGGRVYLIVVKAIDESGNEGVNCCPVVVPHDRSDAAIRDVLARAVAAVDFCLSTGEPPPGFFRVGDGQVIGPKQ